jgi:hypothetical protein
MEYSFDLWEAAIRIIKYLFEGLVVALVAFILPKSRLDMSEILLLALTAASVFSILDLLAPSVSAGARQGVGLGTGFRLVGFGAGV